MKKKYQKEYDIFRDGVLEEMSKKEIFEDAYRIYFYYNVNDFIQNLVEEEHMNLVKSLNLEILFNCFVKFENVSIENEEDTLIFLRAVYKRLN